MARTESGAWFRNSAFEALRGARINDLRRIAFDQILDLAGVANQSGAEARREVPLVRATGGMSSIARPSAFHFFRPPLSTRTSSCPMMRNIHQTRPAE